LVKDIDAKVKTGRYANRSDVIRESVRRKLDIENLVGIIPNTGDSVEEVRALRKKLSQEDLDLEEINRLANA
jgi:Arc/MetJ-type ribon-helix-helix transcriptional regulator